MPLKPLTQKDKPKDNKQILLDLINKQYGPNNAVIMEKALKTQDKQVEEAMLQGGATANDIGKSVGIDLSSLGMPNQLQNQQNTQQYSTKPASSPLGFGGVSMQDGNIVEQQPGILAGLLSTLITGNPKTSANMDLNKLLKVSKIQQAPMEMQAEQRRMAGEERRQKQAERESIRQFGRSVGENEIPELLNQYGVDVNTMVETYGIPAQIDKQTGERRWNLPDMYTQATMAKNKPTTPEERKYLGDIFNAVDTTQEILDDLKGLGIQDPSQIGNFNIPEGFWSDMGPLSIPAKFNLAGQYAKDPKYSAVKSKIERMFQLYRVVITGAQASDKELRALRPLIVSMTQRPGVFFATANDLMNESTRNADTRLQLMESAGRDTSKVREMLEGRKSRKTSVSQPTQSQGGWSKEKETRYQELLKKRGR